MLYAPSTLAFYLLLGLQLVGQRAQAEVRIIIIIAIIAIKIFAIIAIAIIAISRVNFSEKNANCVEILPVNYVLVLVFVQIYEFAAF